MDKDSLKKRYLYKLSTNFIGLLFGLANQAIIPRGLGPKAYGDFSFLNNFFTQVVSFFDMGSSTCFYAKLSQRQKDSGLVSFYFLFMYSVSFLLCIIVFCICFTSMRTIIWPGQKLFYIYLAAVFGLLTWIIQVLNSMTDAYGGTVSAEIFKILQKVFGLVIILALLFINRLTLSNFFFYQYSILIFSGVAFILVLEWTGHSIKQKRSLSLSQIKMYAKEFYCYCSPLCMVSFLVLIISILERWLLQVFAGSTQQGYYSLSYQIGSVCFLFTSSMTPLLMREFSIAFGNKDLGQMAYLFRRYAPTFYSIAAYFACFIVFQAGKVVYIFGGGKYTEAVMAVTIMAFFPIHQTYGQLSSAVFYATGQTRLYRNIGVLFVLIGLPVTYILIAPVGKWGLNMGAAGLAIKMVMLQFIGVNVHLYFNAKYLKFSFWKCLGHQIFVIICLLVIATGATTAGDKLLTIWGCGSVVSSLLFSGVLYTLMVIAFIYFLPIFIGLKKQDIQSLAHRMGMMLKFS